MTVALFALALGAVMLLAYYAGRRDERRQICKFLRFLHGETWRGVVNPRYLASTISAGQHHDIEER